MADIKLVKRYDAYRDKYEDRPGDGISEEISDYINLFDLYDVDGKLYVAGTYILYNYMFFCGDEDISESTKFIIFPLDGRDENTIVRLIGDYEANNLFLYKLDEVPEENVRDDYGLLTEHIIAHIPEAIEAIDETYRHMELKCKGEAKPNIVHIWSANNTVHADSICNFKTEYGLGRAVNLGASRVKIRDGAVLDDICGVQRKLCCYCADIRGCRFDKNEIASAIFGEEIYGDAVICGYESEKTSPLTEDEINAVIQRLNSYKESLK